MTSLPSRVFEMASTRQGAGRRREAREGEPCSHTYGSALAVDTHGASGATRRNDRPPLTIKAGDQDSSRLRVVIQALHLRRPFNR
jgi:hypothetical protein